jgi:hypothetical protein
VAEREALIMRVGGVESELWDRAPVLQDLPATMPLGLRVGDLGIFGVLFFGSYEVLSIFTRLSFLATFLLPLFSTTGLYFFLVWLRQGHPDGYHWSLLHWLQLWRMPGAYLAQERRYDSF